MIKIGTADLMKCASKTHFRTRRVRYTSRGQVLDHRRPKGNLSNSVYNVPRKISICLPKGSSNIYWGMGHVNCRMKKKKIHMAKNDEKSIRPMDDSKKTKS